MIWVALAGAVALAALWYYPVSVDEAWSLVVARRMNRGDRLYRDVFYGAGPLAIWIQSRAFRLLEAQGVVVRGLTCLYIIAQVGAAVVLVGSDEFAAMAVAGIMVGCGGLHLGVHNHYGHLTTAATLWASVAVASGHPLLAGSTVGLGILGRYPMGILATLALSLVVASRGEWQGAVGLVAASLLPVAAAALTRPSSVRWFLGRAVANKRKYLAAARFTPWRWLSTRSWAGWRPVAAQVPVVAAMMLVAFAPVAGLIAVLTIGDVKAGISLALAMVGISIVYPRFDGAHAVAAVGLSGPALTLALTDSGVLVVLGLIGWAMAAVGMAGRVSLTRRRRFRRDVPSLRHLPVRRLRGGVWPDETSDLPPEVFLLRLDAPLVYACGGINNPTPFDYPAASTFGLHGQALVLREFQSGMPLCHGWHDGADPLTPVELLAGIPDEPGLQTPLGRLLRRPA